SQIYTLSLHDALPISESVLSKSWVQQTVKFEHEVTHQQMLDYYREHAKDYDFLAECRWEQLTMRFDAQPSKAAAYAALAHAGNRSEEHTSELQSQSNL